MFGLEFFQLSSFLSWLCDSFTVGKESIAISTLVVEYVWFCLLVLSFKFNRKIVMFMTTMIFIFLSVRCYKLWHDLNLTINNKLLR